MHDGAVVLSGARRSRRVRGLLGSSTSIPNRPLMGNWGLLSPLMLVLSAIGKNEIEAGVTIGFTELLDSRFSPN